MRNGVIGCVLSLAFFAIGQIAFCEEPAKELTVELGGGVKMDLVLIPAGEFMMGDQLGLGLIHKVNITKPFYLGKYEVTQEQWKAVMDTDPSYYKGPKNPVEQVSWEDCQAFLQKLNDKHGSSGGKFTLPTEAQWEYACRAKGTGTHFFGNESGKLSQHGWLVGNSARQTHPVGEKKPNAFGLYDVYGNVWEWCSDWFAGDYYTTSATDDPTGPTSGSLRVVRGGGWNSFADACRSANRFYFAPTHRGRAVGLRVSMTP